MYVRSIGDFLEHMQMCDVLSLCLQLFTHANMMFSNECLVDYNLFEGITATIFMVGMVLSFLVDFVAHQQGQNHGLSSVTPTTAALSKKKRRGNIIILEAGIIFHSIRK